LEASCCIAFATAKEREPHAIGERLIKQYTIDIIEKRTKEEI